jgi:hypothetical protein
MGLPKSITPECFNRGSTVLTTALSHVEWFGGPVRIPPGFPLEACGNDGLVGELEVEGDTSFFILWGRA